MIMDYSKYNNKYYLDTSDGDVFLYHVIVTSEKTGLHCWEVRPNKINIYNDFQFYDEDLSYFIPELCSHCEAIEISEEEFNKLVSKINSLNLEYVKVNSMIKKFVKDCLK